MKIPNSGTSRPDIWQIIVHLPHEQAGGGGCLLEVSTITGGSCAHGRWLLRGGLHPLAGGVPLQYTKEDSTLSSLAVIDSPNQ